VAVVPAEVALNETETVIERAIMYIIHDVAVATWKPDTEATWKPDHRI